MQQTCKITSKWLGLCIAAVASQGCYQPEQSADDFGSYQDPIGGDGERGDGDDSGDGDSNAGDGDSSPGDGDSSPGDGDGDGDTSTGGDGDNLPIDAGTGDPGFDAGTDPPVPHPTSLSFSVLTVSLDGRYAPRNIGAIWIEDSSGAFVKTLQVWARTRKRHLTTFLDATNDDETDAITSATLSQHSTHSVTWDLTDTSGNEVPDGDYRVVMELTDENSSGDSARVDFTKGATPSTLSPPDADHFVNMEIKYE